jgi:hypothetical protein
MSTNERHPLRRLVSTLAVVLGFSPAVGAVAETPRSVAPEAAPAAWVAYAGLVSQTVNARLGGQDPVAIRLRDYMRQMPGADEQSSPPLNLRIWVDGEGSITRIEFPAFVDQQPNDDLRGLLVGLAMAERPPKGMLLPLRLQMRAERKPDAAGDDAQGGTAQTPTTP